MSRVRGTYDVLRYTIEEIGKRKAELFDINKKADDVTVSSGKTYDPNRKFPLRQRIKRESRPYVFKGVEIEFKDSTISGSKKIIYGTEPKDYTVPQFDLAQVSASVAPPMFYVVPPQWNEVIQRLKAHGIKGFRTAKRRVLQVESYRFTDVKWASRPFEGRITSTFKSVTINEKRMFPANSFVIPVAQKNAQVAIHFLEPDSPDSAMFWGFFNAIFEQKEYFESYVMEKIAAEMLSSNPILRKEFEERLKDEEFAKNPRRRLGFFYRRSEFYDKRIGVYPVGRVLTPEFDR